MLANQIETKLWKPCPAGFKKITFRVETKNYQPDIIQYSICILKSVRQA